MLIERTKAGPGRATDNRLLLSASQKDPGAKGTRNTSPRARAGSRVPEVTLYTALGNPVPFSGGGNSTP